MTRLLLILTLFTGCATPRSELAVEARFEEDKPVIAASYKAIIP